MISVLINPRSGGGAGAALIDPMREALLQTEIPHQIVLLESSVRIPELLPILCQGSHIVVVGGDGSFAALATRLEGYSGLLAVYPLGTGNDWARECGLARLARSSTLAEFFISIYQAKGSRLQVWTAQSGTSTLHFVNYLSLGFDGEVITQFSEHRFKGGLFGSLGVLGNRLRYVQAGMSALTYRLPPLRVQPSEQGRSLIAGARSLLFTNIRSIMGIARSNGVSHYGDERCEAVVLLGISSYLRMVGAAMLGFSPPAILGSASHWSVAFEGEVPGQIDGEPLTLQGPTLTISPAFTISVATIPPPQRLSDEKSHQDERY